MMDYELKSPLLSLPTEIRLQIYRWIIPSTPEYLDINLCTRQSNHQSVLSFRKHSMISHLLNQVLNLETIIRCNGLHLLMVSKRTRAEVLPLFSDLTVKFHCLRCYEDLLRNLSFGLGVGVLWMKQIEIFVDLHESDHKPFGPLTMELARTMAREHMQVAQRTTRLYYGTFNTIRNDAWEYQAFTRKKTTNGGLHRYCSRSLSRPEHYQSGLIPHLDGVLNLHSRLVQPSLGVLGTTYDLSHGNDPSWPVSEWVISASFAI